MSIAILISVHDGIVLASDSASTISIAGANGPQGVIGVYNNANKIFNLYKGLPIGCVAFGAGSIGNASIATLIKDFRRSLATADKSVFNPDSYSMSKVAVLLSEFLAAECARVAQQQPRPTLGVMLGGYSTGESLGEGWSLYVIDGVAQAPTELRRKDEVGISWGGEAEAIGRLALGISPNLLGLANQVLPELQRQSFSQMIGMIAPMMQAPLVLAPMPIQDAIDLAKFLVHVAIEFSRFTPGAQTVGGPIEITAITKHEGFKWIMRKHYYDVQWNREAHIEQH
jgi:hypothetical protein